MEFIIGIIIVAFILYLISIALPFLLIFAAVFIILEICWKLYEFYYYKSSAFSEIKQRISIYINDCNELNEHIESLKDTTLISNKTDYGVASYQDSSNCTGKLTEFLDLSQIWDTYLKSDSKRSVIRIFRPWAICSSVSRFGDT